MFYLFQIKYGMDSDSGSSGQTKRRTRGRQITYAESDDSEEVKTFYNYHRNILNMITLID